MTEKSTVQIAVIVLTMNQRDRTLDCLDSVLAQEGARFRVLVWDNGSQDGTAAAIRSRHPDVVVHFSPSNLGVASGRNAAAALAAELYDPAFFLFLDNDMLLEPGFISVLLEALMLDDRVGQAQAKLRFMDRPDRLNDGGGARIDFLRWQISPVGYDEVDRGQHDEIRPCIACGGAMMVRRDVFEQLGGFDDQFDPFGPEDLDFSLRLQKAGYAALYIPRAVAYHRVSHTFGSDYSEQYARHKISHWFGFMRRHASTPQKAGFFLIGAPWLVFRVAVREGRKGNLRVFRGLMRGMLDFFKPPAAL